MVEMKFGSLFAGIGGFDLGLECAGMECVWQVEIDKFCNEVLAKHWPGVKRYGDIKECGKHNLEPVDLVCGGFPCQPFSCAGKRRGPTDDRALWPEMFRIIREVRPAWIIGENVAGFINMGLDQSLADLEAEGYTCETFVLPACAVNAPHRRNRVWIIGKRAAANDPKGPRRRLFHAINERKVKRDVNTSTDPNCNAADTYSQGLQIWEREMPDRTRENGGTIPLGKTGSTWDESWPEVAARLCRMDDGVSSRVDRLKCLGNAVLPQIVEIIGRAIIQVSTPASGEL